MEVPWKVVMKMLEALTLYSPVITHYTCHILQNTNILYSTHGVYVFRIVLKTKSNYFPTQH
jgi:hypothetical protein